MSQYQSSGSIFAGKRQNRLVFAIGFVREVDEVEPVRVNGPTGWIALPTFCPDGRVLAYVNAPTPAGPFSIMRVPVGGGTPEPLRAGLAAMPTDLAWDERGMLLYAQSDGIWEVSAAGGGSPRVVVAAGDGEELASPQLLPGGDSVLFAATSASGAGRWDAASIYTTQLGSTERELVLEGASDARRTRPPTPASRSGRSPTSPCGAIQPYDRDGRWREHRSERHRRTRGFWSWSSSRATRWPIG